MHSHREGDDPLGTPDTDHTTKKRENGKCSYESQDGWFRHEISERVFESDKSTNEQNEVIENVFRMLEKMTERILEIENYHLAK